MTQLAGTGLVITPAMALAGLNPNPDASVAPASSPTAAAAIPITATTAHVEAMAAAALDAAFGATPSAPPTSAAAPAEASAASAAAVPAAFPTAAASAATAAPAVAAQPTDPKQVGGADSPTTSILIHNMFNKDEETEEGWPQEIKEEFIDECSKHGKILSVVVMSNDPGGKIYATFETIDGARACAESLAGRFFDKRQLRAEFVKAEDIPQSA